VKKCKACGAVQSDDRSTCIDCGTLLGRSLSETEEKSENAALEDALESQAIHAEDMRVGARESVLAILSAAAVIAAVPALLRGAADGMSCSFAWTAILCGTVSFLHLLFPRFFWDLERIRHQLWNAWEPASPHTFSVGRILKLLLCGAAIFFAAAAWIVF